MRLTSEFWVQAYLRRVNGVGAFAGLLRRGAKEAGAIFIIIDRLNGTCDLYGPAPQAIFDADDAGARKFEMLMQTAPRADITQRLEREARFDSDLWLIDVEDREGRSFLDHVL